MVEPTTTAALITGGFGIAGGLLGGGGPKRNYGYGFDESQSSSFGVSGSESEGQSSSFSQQFPDTVWGVQSPYLSNIYQQASGLYNQSGASQDQAQGFINQGQGALSSLMNPGVNPMMEVYQQQLQQGLTDYILPTIRREGAGVGMVGGTREGVATGMALQEGQRQQSQFAASLYNQDRDRMLAAAQSTPALAEAGLGVPWYGLNQYAGAVGQPTILGGGGISRSQSTNAGSAFGQEGSQSSSRGENAQGGRGFIEDTFPDRFGQDDRPKGNSGNSFNNDRYGNK